jgi:hypothetical protein
MQPTLVTVNYNYNVTKKNLDSQSYTQLLSHFLSKKLHVCLFLMQIFSFLVHDLCEMSEIQHKRP